ncbi:MAG TPA: pirin family protein [Rhodanobacteraceae bacterium]|nr:pirin family protein [Rhodanobacteraceae bacterium]
MSNLLPLPEPERCEPLGAPRPEIESWPARTADLGGGLSVTRALPLRQHRLVGPWCFFDSYGPLSFSGRKAMDVAPHPHIGLQTVSWLFSGEVLHNDSLGFVAMARPGELNLMTAGRGIAHAEQTPPRNSGKLHGVQLWVALPEAERRRQPGFDHYRDLPVLEPGGGQVRVFMGELDGARSPGRAFSPMVGAEILTGGAGALRVPLDASWEHALVVIEGEFQLDGVRLAPGALHYLGTHRDGLVLETRATARAVLIGGAPFGEAIMIWWNFVARTAEEISEARDDWQAGRRFGEVSAYRGARLAAPELAGRPRLSR